MNIIKLNNADVMGLAERMVPAVRELAIEGRPLYMHPVPRGGVPAAYAMLAALQGKVWTVVTDIPEKADFFMDDIIDSGATMVKYCDQYPGKPFLALVDKTSPETLHPGLDGWITFPWEADDNDEGSGIEQNIVRLLQYIGEDPKRGGLLDTPKRVAKAWAHWAGGYVADIPSILKTFEDGADGCDEMIVVRDIPFYTHCEHHLAPFFGTVTVAYVPNGKIVGLSKIPRVVDAFARRLQVQERLTNQIADAIQDHLAPLGVGVVIKARHLCMESRGIKQRGSETITNALRGVMKDKPEARSEFLALALSTK